MGVDRLVPWVDPVGLAVLEEEVSWMPLEAAQVDPVDHLVQWAVPVDLLVPWVVLVDLLVGPVGLVGLQDLWVVLVGLLVPWAVLVGLLVVLVDHPVLWVVLVSLLVPWAALVAPVVQEEEVSWMPLAGVDLVREGFPLNTSCMYTLQAEDYTNQISNEENKTEYTYVEK